MALPAAVQKQVDAAEAFINGSGQSGVANAEPTSIEPAAPATPAVPAAAAPAAPEPAQAAEPVQATAHATNAQDPEDGAWKSRYLTLQGKYNAEIPRLQEELRKLREQPQHSPSDSAELQELRAEVARLKQHAPSSPAATFAGEHALRAEYGNELIDGLLALVKQQVQPVQQQVAQVGSSIQQSTAQARESSLVTRLKEQGIDFLQRNNDPLFLEWLKEVELFSGMERHKLLQAAYDSGDLDRVVTFFTAYDGQATGGRATPAPTPTPAPGPQLNQHVTLTSSASQADQVPAQNVWTGAQITEFYAERDRAARGLKSKYTVEQLAQLEQELFAFLRSQRNA